MWKQLPLVEMGGHFGFCAVFLVMENMCEGFFCLHPQPELQYIVDGVSTQYYNKMSDFEINKKDAPR